MKEDLKKVALSLGIAIPASLLSIGNANSVPTNTELTNSNQLIEQITKKQGSNEVINRITLGLRISENGTLLAHANAHTDRATHTDRHSNQPHSNYHSNNQGYSAGTTCVQHTDNHTDRSGDSSHTNANSGHTNTHTDNPDC
ncbi:MAG: hypothetical protein LBQ31_07895 [Bacteroidales bacterium]|jgi:hypothetical protein|nr:hypothetical protein [Bacteroidales bacterium]